MFSLGDYLTFISKNERRRGDNDLRETQVGAGRVEGLDERVILRRRIPRSMRRLPRATDHHGQLSKKFSYTLAKVQRAGEIW